jgi:hypothetical protein
MSGVARKLARVVGFVLPPIIVLVSFVRPSFLQTTVDTGSIVGTVSDPSGAVISGATVTITDIAKGQVIELATNSGSFNSGALIPGNYKTQISARGFSSAEVPTTAHRAQSGRLSS